MYKHSISFILADLTCSNDITMESYTLTAAVRDFHFYWRYWQLQEHEKPFCCQKPGNAFVRFAIKTAKESWVIEVHLPRENLHITKYYLEQVASMYYRLSSEHYRLLPLVEGGLEVECHVAIYSPATIPYSKLTQRYLHVNGFFA